MNKRKKAFTLIELLVVVAIIALLISILLPSLSRARELSKRLVCGSNVKGMGTAFKIYANDYDESWPLVPHRKATATLFVTFVDGTAGNRGGVGIPADNPPPVSSPAAPSSATPKRHEWSAADGASQPSTKLSVTRNMWMLVRSGDVTPKQYVCPSSGDSVANEQNIDQFYDFKAQDNVSYGYQVPFGPFATRPSEDIDPRMAVAADKSPWAGSGAPADLPGMGSSTTDWDVALGYKTPQSWRKYNSPNHGGSGSGEGQNVLFGDGHATFEKTPIVGIDKDNIYTKMNSLLNLATNNIVPMASGAKPYDSVSSSGGPAYPGFRSLSASSDASTDSLIWP